jgi:hypothetical protein
MVIPGARQVGRATAALVWASIVVVLADVANPLQQAVATHN